MNLYQQILKETPAVDQPFLQSRTDWCGFSIEFPVPSGHQRREVLQSYKLVVDQITAEQTTGAIVLLDSSLTDLEWLKTSVENAYQVVPSESTLKELHWLEKYLSENDFEASTHKKVIAIGGALTMNVASFIAEKFQWDLVLCPTTVIGIADGNGGKVRMNLIDNDRYYKHFYKSFYEPSEIIVDPRFLNSLSGEQIRDGLPEIIKHGLYQSEALLNFLASDEFDPFSNVTDLLRVALWSAALKALCLHIDSEETATGSRPILRGGHEFSDRIEEDLCFSIPHGRAVAIGIEKELQLANSPELSIYKKICEKLGIPLSITEYAR